MFKRRNPRSTLASIREFFYPRSGWKRAFEYLKHRIKRLPDTPHRIALGLSIGAFVCFLPFFGLHFILAALLAYILRGNVLASLIGTFVGNPVTFPFIAALSYRFGLFLLGAQEDQRALARLRRGFSEMFETAWSGIRQLFGYKPTAMEGFLEFWWTVLWPYTLGGLLPGLITGLIVYVLSKPLVEAYQSRRKGRLIAKFKQMREARKTKGLKNEQ